MFSRFPVDIKYLYSLHKVKIVVLTFRETETQYQFERVRVRKHVPEFKIYSDFSNDSRNGMIFLLEPTH